MCERYYITNSVKFVGNNAAGDTLPVLDNVTVNKAHAFKYTTAINYLNNQLGGDPEWNIQKIYNRDSRRNYVVTTASHFVGKNGTVVRAFKDAKPFKSTADAENYIKNHRELSKTIGNPVIIDDEFAQYDSLSRRKFTAKQLAIIGKKPDERIAPRKPFAKASKIQIYNKSGGYCAICRRPLSFEEMTVDHIQPLSRGGDNSMDNLAVLCGSCNKRKDNNTDEELSQWAETITVNNILKGDISAAFPVIRAMVRGVNSGKMQIGDFV